MPRILLRLACLLLRHRLRVVQHFGRESRRIKCERCDLDVGMHDTVIAVLPWDADLEEMYRLCGYRVLEPRFSDGTPLGPSVMVAPYTTGRALPTPPAGPARIR